MTQSLYTPGEASTMVQIMCERVNLSQRAGSYILSMARLYRSFPNGLVNMVEVAQAIKYVSENQKDLKPQFRMNPPRTSVHLPNDEPGKFTFLK
ncbi:hypothetical protein QCN32_gp75 [Arthrobacter phage Niktson]|uniref:Uncharacterized protein n=1 Tax=Arthrobacter phage Niktson TaxID=2014347 RepID=A0A218M5Q1_9CAUD|nr:hypothetical protein QCN32_gp75 [Arthrobacter phage Niktson]ASD52294.1 hypothetical protein NIKTSON_75 [Arthrobacter phage Niktson]ASD52388.1 hypothetical protein ELEPHANTMAN_75 [Arthrobacter phage ElephantMan]